MKNPLINFTELAGLSNRREEELRTLEANNELPIAKEIYRNTVWFRRDSAEEWVARGCPWFDGNNYRSLDMQLAPYVGRLNQVTRALVELYRLGAVGRFMKPLSFNDWRYLNDQVQGGLNLLTALKVALIVSEDYHGFKKYHKLSQAERKPISLEGVVVYAKAWKEAFEWAAMGVYSGDIIIEEYETMFADLADLIEESGGIEAFLKKFKKE